jgi:hypothetical protein
MHITITATINATAFRFEEIPFLVVLTLKPRLTDQFFDVFPDVSPKIKC